MSVGVTFRGTDGLMLDQLNAFAYNDITGTNKLHQPAISAYEKITDTNKLVLGRPAKFAYIYIKEVAKRAINSGFSFAPTTASLHEAKTCLSRSGGNNISITKNGEAFICFIHSIKNMNKTANIHLNKIFSGQGVTQQPAFPEQKIQQSECKFCTSRICL